MPVPLLDEPEWDFEQYTLELTVAVAKLDKLDIETSASVVAVQSVTAHFPKRQRTTAFAFLMNIQNRVSLRALELKLSHLQADEKDIREHARELRTFYTGLILLGVALLASAVLHVKDSSTTAIIRIISALGLGLTIAYVPGFFSLEGSASKPGVKVAFKAAGAFAALVMVYMFDPGWFSSLFHSH